VVCLQASLAAAWTGDSYSAGTGIISNPATASPGTTFVLDYTPMLVDQHHLNQPYQAVGFLMSFMCHTPYTELNIQLNSGQTIYEFPPTPPSTDATSAFLYDPAYLSPSGSVPSYVMAEAWKSEMADGLLEGRFWVEGTPFAPQWATLSGTGEYIVPEPATVMVLAMAAACLIRRR